MGKPKIEGLRDFFTAERIDQAMDTLVTKETLAEYEPSLREILARQGYHDLQVTEIIRNNRVLMQDGLPHSRALKQASEQVGRPARRRTIFWDEQLEQRLKAGE